MRWSVSDTLAKFPTAAKAATRSATATGEGGEPRRAASRRRRRPSSGRQSAAQARTRHATVSASPGKAGEVEKVEKRRKTRSGRAAPRAARDAALSAEREGWRPR